jgi:hypothetical protein
MTTHLWNANTPQHFWRCQPELSETQWQAAILRAAPLLGLPSLLKDIEDLPRAVLGEGQFGPGHWHLSRAKRLYYVLKPILPRSFTQLLRQFYHASPQASFPLGWPIEDRYVRFQWEVMRQLLELTGQLELTFIHFWPDGRRFALVLTHDIETAEGQAYVRDVAALEEDFGFRSSFNFVPERYPLDQDLMRELRERGFEVGVHGLKHDGKLFNSRPEFMRRADRINHYLKDFGAVGFRAPLTHRNPEWMQALEIEYDLSFFDTDPFEPIPGGTMSIWPFMIGHFVELPYTLVQDSTLTSVLGERSARIWLQKLEFIERYYGMALINSHPDYLKDAVVRSVYTEFLQAVSKREDYWQALPRDVARWWRNRAQAESVASLPGAIQGQIRWETEALVIKS